MSLDPGTGNGRDGFEPSWSKRILAAGAAKIRPRRKANERSGRVEVAKTARRPGGASRKFYLR
jgi:hypothetical protein